GSTRSFAEPPGEKIVLDRQLANLGVKLLDLARRRRLRLRANLRIKRPRRMVQQLLLPGVNLVGMNLMALRQVGYRRLFAQRLQRNLRLQRRVNLPSRLRHLPAPSYPIRSRLLPTIPLVPKSGATSVVCDPLRSPFADDPRSADSRESFKILAARSRRVDWRLEAQAALDPFGRGATLGVAHSSPGQQHPDWQPRHGVAA